MREEQHCFRVMKDHYKSEKYDTKERFISYFNQIKIIRELGIKNILEIGVGTGFLSNYLKREGFVVNTADVVKEFKPDYVIDLKKDFSLPKNAFDAVVAFEVLEHVEFKRFKDILIKFKEASNNFVIISIPIQVSFFQLVMRVPACPNKLNVFLPIERRWSNVLWGGGTHYWEAGNKDFPLKKIRGEINETGLRIVREFIDADDPFHYFFVMKKK